MFVAFHQAIYRMALDGTAAVALPNNTSTITGLHTNAGYIYAFSGAGVGAPGATDPDPDNAAAF
ncbi:MAG: hypothetical protein HC822_15285 [Oscillochloris sp.]|nr:hypothetical protein [Oscillochloris sp.]